MAADVPEIAEPPESVDSSSSDDDREIDDATIPEIEGGEVEFSDDDYLDGEQPGDEGDEGESVDDGGLFAGDETTDRTGDERQGQEGGDSGGPSEATVEPSRLEETINEGAARLAVVGLDEGKQKDDLETEFVDVFGAFRLGFYGEQVAEEYLMVDDDDVDPVWGLLGTAIVCSAFAIWMRPDGDEQIRRARAKLTSGKPSQRSGSGRVSR